MSSSRTLHLTGLLLVLVAVALIAAAAGATGARAGGVSRLPVWVKHWPPTAGAGTYLDGYLARAGTGDLYVAGQENGTWCMVRYTAAGKRKWVRGIPNAGGGGHLYAVAAGADGRVAAVGTESSDLWIVCAWDRAGGLLRKWQFQVHGGNTPLSCAFAPDGTLVVVGTVTRPGTSDDGLIVKYSPTTGKRMWSHWLDGPSHGSDEFDSVAVDARGYIYAAGWDYAADRANDAVVIRYSPKGKVLWTQHWAAPAAKHEMFYKVAVRNGRVACAGITENDPDPAHWQNRGLVAVYDTRTGALKWDAQFVNPDDPLRDSDWTLTGVDSKGRVAVAGWYATSDTPGERSWATTVFSPTGAIGTVQRLAGTRTSDNVPAALVSTPGGAVYVAGTLGDVTKGQNLYVLALGSTGVPKWGSYLDGGPQQSGSAAGLAATSTDLYVSGYDFSSLELLKYRR